MRAENERARSSEALDAARAEVLRLGEVLGPADLQAHAKEPRRRAHAARDHGLKRKRRAAEASLCEAALAASLRHSAGAVASRAVKSCLVVVYRGCGQRFSVFFITFTKHRSSHRFCHIVVARTAVYKRRVDHSL